MSAKYSQSLVPLTYEYVTMLFKLVSYTMSSVRVVLKSGLEQMLEILDQDCRNV
jgi:hypothetical protein